MRKMKRVILTAVMILIILSAVSLYRSNHCLTVTYYEVGSSKVDASFRLVQLTDLHNYTYGEKNKKLLEKIQAQCPDLIVCTGDLINAGEEDTSSAAALLEALGKLAPVYVSYGNHEKEYEELWGRELLSVFEKTNVQVLDTSYQDIEASGQKLRIGGIYGYCTPEKYLKTGEADPEECAFLREFQSTESLTLLLAHMPFAWIANDGISEWEIDCVLAGHDHGGQVRIPLIGGLYAPDQGFFPGKDCGRYESQDQQKVMLLSRGLGSAEKIPRFYNVPEIVVVDFVPEK